MFPLRASRARSSSSVSFALASKDTKDIYGSLNCVSAWFGHRRFVSHHLPPLLDCLCGRRARRHRHMGRGLLPLVRAHSPDRAGATGTHTGSAHGGDCPCWRARCRWRGAHLACPLTNHALQRTAAGRRGCNRRASWPPSLSLDRWRRQCRPPRHWRGRAVPGQPVCPGDMLWGRFPPRPLAGEPRSAGAPRNTEPQSPGSPRRPCATTRCRWPRRGCSRPAPRWPRARSDRKSGSTARRRVCGFGRAAPR